MQLHSVVQSQLRSLHAVLRHGFSIPSPQPLQAVPDGACTSVSVNQQSCFTCAPRCASERLIPKTAAPRVHSEGWTAARSPCARQASPRAQSRTPNPVSCTAARRSRPAGRARRVSQRACHTRAPTARSEQPVARAHGSAAGGLVEESYIVLVEVHPCGRAGGGGQTRWPRSKPSLAGGRDGGERRRTVQRGQRASEQRQAAAGSAAARASDRREYVSS
jgi:hypothetical protein